MSGRCLLERGEVDVYRSDLASLLPDGLALPRVHLVSDIDALSACFWLEAVDADASPWDDSTFECAAYRLGRLAARRDIAPVADLGMQDVVRSYAYGRIDGQILPALHSEDLWTHPLIAETFSPRLRTRLLAAADAVPTYMAELDAAPLGAAHGDACPRNLLVPRGRPDDFVLIDFAFWCRAPLGFDLTQLPLGEIQLGERSTAQLPELDEVCLVAYARGLADQGGAVPLDMIRRTHALLMLLFAGLTAVPIELLFGGPPSGDAHVLRGRAAAAEHVLDLVGATTACRVAPDPAEHEPGGPRSEPNPRCANRGGCDQRQPGRTHATGRYVAMDLRAAVDPARVPGWRPQRRPEAPLAAGRPRRCRAWRG